ncbi:MAG TPA: hypothetical protein VGP04_03880, partial [Pseudonocardiaceae bacterium]|nr:hypothetical protein [Pseudonocardiaceae bacterium]
QSPSTVPAMPDTPSLHPATPDEIATALSFALQFEGRKRVHQADDAMARITAARLVRHLERSGFVLMKRPPAAPPTTAGHMPRLPLTD